MSLENTGNDTGKSAATPDKSAVHSINLTKTGSAIRSIGEKFTASPVSDSDSLTVPVFTSPGRFDLSAHLSLSYNLRFYNTPLTSAARFHYTKSSQVLRMLKYRAFSPGANIDQLPSPSAVEGGKREIAILRRP